MMTHIIENEISNDKFITTSMESQIEAKDPCDITTGSAIVGVPTMALFPPVNYQFNISTERFKLEIPLKGTYKDLDPDFFTEEDGDFILFENNIMDIPAISKVLFGMAKYPALSENQFFMPITIQILENTVILIGQVVVFNNEN